jgi:Fe-S-cluster containining protein
MSRPEKAEARQFLSGLHLKQDDGEGRGTELQGIIMKKTKRLVKLLESECGQCSSCCREIQVEVTDRDIERLSRHTGMPADKLVSLYSKSEIESETDSDWIKLSYGKRSMALRKRRNGDCIFLSEGKTCKVYTARPMTCRIFPVCVVFDDDFKIVDLEISEVISDKTIKCKRTKGNGGSYKAFISRARRSQDEYEMFRKKLDEWNDFYGRGLKNDFLHFLGLKTSENGSR